MILLLIGLILLAPPADDESGQPLPEALRRELLARAESIENLRLVARVTTRQEGPSGTRTDAFEETIIWRRGQGTVVIRRTLFPANASGDPPSVFYYVEGTRTQMIGPLFPDADRYVVEVIDAPGKTDIGAGQLPGGIETASLLEEGWSLVHDTGETVEIARRDSAGSTMCQLSRSRGGMLLLREATRHNPEVDVREVTRFEDPLAVHGFWIPVLVTTTGTRSPHSGKAPTKSLETRVILDCVLNDPAISLPRRPRQGTGSIIADRRSIFGGRRALLGYIKQDADVVSIDEATIDRLAAVSGRSPSGTTGTPAATRSGWRPSVIALSLAVGAVIIGLIAALVLRRR